MDPQKAARMSQADQKEHLEKNRGVKFDDPDKNGEGYRPDDEGVKEFIKNTGFRPINQNVVVSHPALEKRGIIETPGEEKTNRTTVLECADDCQFIKPGDYVYLNANMIGYNLYSQEHDKGFLLIKESDVRMIMDESKE